MQCLWAFFLPFESKRTWVQLKKTFCVTKACNLAGLVSHAANAFEPSQHVRPLNPYSFIGEKQ